MMKKHTRTQILHASSSSNNDKTDHKHYWLTQNLTWIDLANTQKTS
jgi:hypothetical protein